IVRKIRRRARPGARAVTQTRPIRQWALIALVAALAGGAGYAYRAWRLGGQQAHDASEQVGVEKLAASPLPDLDGRLRSLSEWRGAAAGRELLGARWGACAES